MVERSAGNALPAPCSKKGSFCSRAALLFLPPALQAARLGLSIESLHRLHATASPERDPYWKKGRCQPDDGGSARVRPIQEADPSVGLCILSPLPSLSLLLPIIYSELGKVDQMSRNGGPCSPSTSITPSSTG